MLGCKCHYFDLSVNQPYFHQAMKESFLLYWHYFCAIVLFMSDFLFLQIRFFWLSTFLKTDNYYKYPRSLFSENQIPPLKGESLVYKFCIWYFLKLKKINQYSIFLKILSLLSWEYNIRIGYRFENYQNLNTFTIEIEKTGNYGRASETDNRTLGFHSCSRVCSGSCS